MKPAPSPIADTWAAVQDPPGRRDLRPRGEPRPFPVDERDPAKAGQGQPSSSQGPAGRGSGGPGSTGWAPPPDATPERTAVALARWQRRRTVRVLLGTPHGEVGPREGVRGAALCGCVLGVVLKVAVLTVGAWP